MLRAQPAGERNLETILVVEDDELIRGCIVAPLTRAGYEVLSAGNGAEGARVFERHSEALDLLVTDISMPGMLGTDLARFARKIRPDIKVIFASGSVHLEETNPQTYIQGSVFLSKPFTIEELLRTVKEVLGKPSAGILTAAPAAARLAVI
jgi:two-component system, cell cycle sensor histidine kinase and response regulator CckA